MHRSKEKKEEKEKDKKRTKSNEQIPDKLHASDGTERKGENEADSPQSGGSSHEGEKDKDQHQTTKKKTIASLFGFLKKNKDKANSASTLDKTSNTEENDGKLRRTKTTGTITNKDEEKHDDQESKKGLSLSLHPRKHKRTHSTEEKSTSPKDISADVKAEFARRPTVAPEDGDRLTINSKRVSATEKGRKKKSSSLELRDGKPKINITQYKWNLSDGGEQNRSSLETDDDSTKQESPVTISQMNSSKDFEIRSSKSTSGGSVNDTLSSMYSYQFGSSGRLIISKERENDGFILPDTVVTKIFQNFLLSDLCRASEVCIRWNRLFRDKGLWNNLYQFYYHKLKGAATDANIWEDKDLEPKRDENSRDNRDISESSDVELNKLTLNQLVAKLTPSAKVVDHVDFGAFLVTYKTFTTPQNLVRKLIQRYHVPEPQGLSQDEHDKYIRNFVKPIQLRVCNLLKHLIDTYFDDLTSDVLIILKVFVRGMIDQSDTLSRALANSFVRKLKSRQIPENRVKYNIDARSAITLQQDILEASETVIAQQLTIIEFEYFSQIKVKEFIGGDKKADIVETNVDKMVDHFNDVSRWVQDVILKEEKLRQRARRIETFIQIAQELRRLNNFETMMAIISGINDTAVHRLNFTKAEIKQRYNKMMDDMVAMMSPDKSYQKFRKIVKEIVARKAQCIPYLGVYRRDLIYYEEGGKGNKDEINFKMKRKLFVMLMELEQFQKNPYTLELDRIVSAKLRTLPPLPNGMTHEVYKSDILWNLSLKREPRNASRNDLAL